jgi:hypothetical protein
MKLCAFCGEPANTKCGACRSVVYCNAACQKADWKTHRIGCRTQQISGPEVSFITTPPAGPASPAVAGSVRRAAGSDSGIDDDVWAVSMSAQLAEVPALIPVKTALVGAGWIQHVWYHGNTVPSATLASRFRAAHAKARAGVPGLVQTDIEQQLLASPVVYLGLGSVDSEHVSLKPAHALWMLGVRFAVTPLSPEAVAAIVKFAERIRRASPPYRPGTVGLSDGVTGITAALAPAAAQMLQWLLNTPPFSAGYALCLGDTPSLDVVVITSSGELDEAALEAACCRVIPRPTPAQTCVSRLACFFCGAHPLAKGVQLGVCGGCEAVSYCGRMCATADWAEHHRECARTRPRTHRDPRTPVTALPALGLKVSRGDTETSKEVSMRMPIAVKAAAPDLWVPASILRIALVPTLGKSGLVATNLWVVNGGAGGGLDSALDRARHMY